MRPLAQHQLSDGVTASRWSGRVSHPDPQLRFEHALRVAMSGYWCPALAGRSLRGAARPHIGFNEVVEIAKDGQSWRIGTNAQIGWIANGTY
jgi:hypothetical protein